VSNPARLSGQTFADQLPAWNVRAKTAYVWVIGLQKLMSSKPASLATSVMYEEVRIVRCSPRQRMIRELAADAVALVGKVAEPSGVILLKFSDCAASLPVHELPCFAILRIQPNCAHVVFAVGKELTGLIESVRFVPSTFLRHRVCKVYLVFRKNLLKNFRKPFHKLFRAHRKSASASRPRARIKVHFARRYRKTSHSEKIRSAMSISSIMSTGFTTAQK
jgi:hypothetical protein